MRSLQPRHCDEEVTREASAAAGTRAEETLETTQSQQRGGTPTAAGYKRGHVLLRRFEIGSWLQEETEGQLK